MDKTQAGASPLNRLGFHGTYRPKDVTFLLQIDDLQPTSLAEKEYLIQSGKKHYMNNGIYTKTAIQPIA